MSFSLCVLLIHRGILLSGHSFLLQLCSVHQCWRGVSWLLNWRILRQNVGGAFAALCSWWRAGKILAGPFKGQEIGGAVQWERRGVSLTAAPVGSYGNSETVWGQVWVFGYPLFEWSFTLVVFDPWVRVCLSETCILTSPVTDISTFARQPRLPVQSRRDTSSSRTPSHAKVFV